MPDIAIVTGHSSGLGLAFTERLLESGTTVIGVSRRGGRIPAHPNLIEIVGSVDDQTSVDEAFAAAKDAGQLRLLINCAGQGVFGDIGSYSVADVQKALAGNLVGLISFTDRAVSEMAGDGGDIVSIMSTASKKLRTGESVYTAAKWGAKAYTRTVREAIKAAKQPIRVFEVYPCGMNTSFWVDAVRPVTDGSSFPSPGPIADSVLEAVHKQADSYQQELTFERN